MKPYGVTVQTKPIWQYFHMILFSSEYMFLPFKSVVDETRGVTIQMELLYEYFRMIPCLFFTLLHNELKFWNFAEL